MFPLGGFSGLCPCSLGGLSPLGGFSGLGPCSLGGLPPLGGFSGVGVGVVGVGAYPPP